MPGFTKIFSKKVNSKPAQKDLKLFKQVQEVEQEDVGRELPVEQTYFWLAVIKSSQSGTFAAIETWTKNESVLVTVTFNYFSSGIV